MPELDDLTGGAAAGAGSFDGVLKGWENENSLPILNIPKTKDEFILYMACEMFKNQNIKSPKSQAKNSIDYAKCLYDELKRRGYLE